MDGELGFKNGWSDWIVFGVGVEVRRWLEWLESG